MDRLELVLEVGGAREPCEGVSLIVAIGEYPAGSVACAESTGEMKSGTRNAWFILFTNSMIDWGKTPSFPRRRECAGDQIANQD